MYHIAIVEDEKACSRQLQKYLEQYQNEKNMQFKVSVFSGGTELLTNYQPVYDLILLDIEMPGINGIDTAAKIRETDGEVALMFITNLAGYAIRGYEVEALDFVTKPVSYYQFAMRLSRCFRRLGKRESRESCRNQKSRRRIAWNKKDGRRCGLIMKSIVRNTKRMTI